MAPSGAVLLLPQPEREVWHRPVRLAHALQRSHPVRWLPRHEAGLPAGSFLIPYPNVSSAEAIMDRARREDVAAQLWRGALPPAGRQMRAARVALYGGGGPPYHHRYVLALAGIAADVVSPAHIIAGGLAGYDAFIVPGGGEEAMRGQLRPLGEDGCRAIARFVSEGGLYIGCCAGAVDACIAPVPLRRACPEQRHLQLLDVPVRPLDMSDPDGLGSPGVGVYIAEASPEQHPIWAGLPRQIEMTHYHGPLFGPVPKGVDALCAPVALTDRFTPAEHFFQSGAQSDRGRTIERAIRQAWPAAVAGPHGHGYVVLFGSHPEFGTDPLLEQPGPAALLLINAVVWHAARSRSGEIQDDRLPLVAQGGQGRRETLSIPNDPGLLTGVAEGARAVRVAAARLHQIALVPEPAWLDSRRCAALFGLIPHDIWRQSVAAIERWCDELIIAAAARQPAPVDAEQWRIQRRAPERSDALLGDTGGFMSAPMLLERATSMLERAWCHRAIVLPSPTHDPFEGWDVNPYHLVASSYLSAVGLVLGAVLQVRARRLEMLD